MPSTGAIRSKFMKKIIITCLSLATLIILSGIIYYQKAIGNEKYLENSVPENKIIEIKEILEK